MGARSVLGVDGGVTSFTAGLFSIRGAGVALIDGGGVTFRMEVFLGTTLGLVAIAGEGGIAGAGTVAFFVGDAGCTGGGKARVGRGVGVNAGIAGGVAGVFSAGGGEGSAGVPMGAGVGAAIPGAALFAVGVAGSALSGLLKSGVDILALGAGIGFSTGISVVDPVSFVEPGVGLSFSFAGAGSKAGVSPEFVSTAGLFSSSSPNNRWSNGRWNREVSLT